MIYCISLCNDYGFVSLKSYVLQLFFDQVIRNIILTNLYHFYFFCYKNGDKGRRKTHKKEVQRDDTEAYDYKKQKQGVKLPVKYNLDGIFIRESAVHLTSYLGVLARTIVPIRYKTWHVVPKQLKDKLWDSIEVTISYLNTLMQNVYHS